MTLAKKSATEYPKIFRIPRLNSIWSRDMIFLSTRRTYTHLGLYLKGIKDIGKQDLEHLWIKL